MTKGPQKIKGNAAVGAGKNKKAVMGKVGRMDLCERGGGKKDRPLEKSTEGHLKGNTTGRGGLTCETPEKRIRKDDRRREFGKLSKKKLGEIKRKNGPERKPDSKPG